MTPYGLQTEQRVEPLGLDEPRPRLSWKLAADRRGAAQSAYRITAAAAEPDLNDPSRLLWDTGRRESGGGSLMPWDGPALQSGTRYHWRVETWHETGAHAGAAQSWFETGLLHPDEWTAVWIGRDAVALPPEDPPTDEDLVSPRPAEAPLYLRHEFRLTERPVRARLYATARGVYEPAMNSFNHYSLGSVRDWLYGHVAGIDQAPDSVAYREIVLRPRPGGNLTWAHAEQETGKVACGWHLGNGLVTVTVTVPLGSTATVHIPTPTRTACDPTTRPGSWKQPGQPCG
jgi:hypothetical protein